MYCFNIDRGGTFTDFYIQTIDNNTIVSEQTFKVPSISAEGEGPIMGISSFMEKKGLTKKGQKIPTKYIESVNIGTTIATNALLQRKGCSNVIIVSKGFKDILTIRTQARPDIFDLTCKLPQPLATHVLQINSRLYCCDTGEGNAKIEQGIFYKKASEQDLEQLLEQLKKLKPQSIGISICNSYLSERAENDLQEFLKGAGYSNIQKGSQYKEMGYLKRTQTASLDAFLNLTINHYFHDLMVHFDHPQQMKFRVMKSDGGFTSQATVKASDMLLSGPAGGLIGYCRIADLLQNKFGLEVDYMVGLDMGGTSTDFSKVKGRSIALNYSFETEGLEICTPHLQIETIAAGGGSKLGFQRGLLTVGPESVGSNPGPVCYGVGSQLALTDANLILNRLDPMVLARVFGIDKQSSIKRDLSIKHFEKLTEQINLVAPQKKTIYEIAEGFIEIANQLMAKSARKILTLGKPNVLIIFGSAAGQHCCDIAQKIGVDKIFIHRHSGILSAYGLSKAYETTEVKTFLAAQIDSNTFNFQQLLKLIEEKRQSKNHNHLKFNKLISQISIGYVGTNYSFKVPLSKDIIKQFEKLHFEENGFSLPQKKFKIDYLIDTYISFPKQYELNQDIGDEEDYKNYFMEEFEMFYGKKFQKVGKYLLSQMKNCRIKGPIFLLSQTSSIFVKENWEAWVANGHVRLSKIEQNYSVQNIDKELQKEADPIKLTIYSTRLMGIAEEMGKILRKTSISTNIKERLDFSCGIFDWNGSLLANAPHLPVHLGSMETAVVEQIKRGIKTGDVILTNHPDAGGSHLPDLTVVSCFQIAKGVNMFVASRGHHADIGGITPGSMPPFSKHISEQGVAIEKFELVKNGEFLVNEVQKLFQNSRRTNDNVSDLLAQISANQIGMKLLKKFVKECGLDQFQLYVKFICQNAKECVEELLYKFSLKNQFPSLHSIENEESMDDGTHLKLKLTLDRNLKTAIFDFNGTGPQVLGNTNAPKSITRSAVLYCLRSLIGKQIPLNSGCLIPVQIIIPEGTILNPSKTAAVVGGNVETSQRLVDLILKPFEFVACSQGTMNNFLFGNNQYSYYETICGGSGAGSTFHGQTIQCHMTNTRITDVEHLERNYPVILKRFQKRIGSGGKGKFNGGCGVSREVVFLEPMEVSILSERRVFGAYGLLEGLDGDFGHNYLITQSGLKKSVGSKGFFKVEPHQSVLIETPGGGGFGKAKQY